MESILSLILASKDPEKALVCAIEFVKDFLSTHGANPQEEGTCPQTLEELN